MRRPTVYYVGGERRKFTRAQWEILRAALQSFKTGWHYGPGVKPAEYGCGTASILDGQVFYVSRADYKPLNREERSALYWFFRGVMATADFLEDADGRASGDS
jgi:hypothetical protein